VYRTSSRHIGSKDHKNRIDNKLFVSIKDDSMIILKIEVFHVKHDNLQLQQNDLA